MPVLTHYICVPRYGFNVTSEETEPGFGPNVIATLPSDTNPNTFVVVGAHFDSRGRDRASTTEVAPGANDDGSGVAMQLELAKAIHSWDQEFEYGLIIASFVGEEQGLIGSGVLATKMKAEGKEVLAMFAADMIAYHKPGNNLQVGLATQSVSPILNDLFTDVAKDYTPEMEVCTTTGTRFVCCYHIPAAALPPQLFLAPL